MTKRSSPIAGLALGALLGAAAWALPAAAQDAPATAQMEPAQMEKRLAQLTKMLTEADANEDGKTTKEELAKHRADQFSKLDRNSDGVVSTKDKPRGPIMKKKYSEVFDQVVPQYDTDLDGTITRAEWNTMKRDPFAMLDANGDGAIEHKSEIPTPEMLQAAAAAGAGA